MQRGLSPRAAGVHPCVIEPLPSPSGRPPPACCWPSSAPPRRAPRRSPSPRARRRVLRAARILDGRGEVLDDRDLVVRDGRIAEIVPRGAGRGDRVYDLTALTVLPGYIDTHVHIGNHFDDDGRVHRAENDSSAAHLTLHGAENAYRTLMNGITTMQSLGAPEDAELRAWIDRGEVPGPRLLSSLGAVREDTGTPGRDPGLGARPGGGGGRRRQGLRVDEHPLRRASPICRRPSSRRPAARRTPGAEGGGSSAPVRRAAARGRRRVRPGRARLAARAGGHRRVRRERHVSRQPDRPALPQLRGQR